MKKDVERMVAGRRAAEEFMARFADYAASEEYARKQVRVERRDAAAVLKMLAGNSRMARATRDIPGFSAAESDIIERAKAALA